MRPDDTALTKAYDDLERAIESLPGDETIVEDLDALEPELDAVPEAYRETFDLSGCA